MPPTEMEAAPARSRLSPDLLKMVVLHLPMWWRAMCCRVCKVWQKDLEEPQQGQGDDTLVDYGLATLCCALARWGASAVMRRILRHSPSGIAADLGRMDQVRRFVERHRCRVGGGPHLLSEDEWMQLASQEPDAGWLCEAVSETQLEDRSLMRQVVGKPQDFEKVLGTLTHTGPVYSVAFSPDQKYVACGEIEGLRIWEAVTGKEVCSLKGHSAYNPGCTCQHENEDVDEPFEANPECPMKGHSGKVLSVAYSPDGSQLASAGVDKTVRLWDPKTMKEQGTLKGHSSWVYCVTYSPDGKRIASASLDKTVRIWDAETMEEEGTLMGHSAGVNSVAFSPDSKFIATGSGNAFLFDNSVRIWEVATGKEVRSLQGHTRYNAECTCTHGEHKNDYEANPECPVTTGHSASINSVAFSPDSKFVASGSGDLFDTDYSVRIWEVATGKQVCCLRGHSDYVRCVAYSPDGKHIASASDDETVKVWDAATMEEVGTLEGTITSWKNLDPEAKELASQVQSGKCKVVNGTGQYIVSATRDTVYVHRVRFPNAPEKMEDRIAALEEMVAEFLGRLAEEESTGTSHGHQLGTPLACFHCPAQVETVFCRGNSVVAGCRDGQWLILESALLAW